MKKTTKHLLVAVSFILLSMPVHSKVNNSPVLINTDIAVEGLRIDKISDLKCGKDSIFISFRVTNKLNTAGLKAKIKISVNGIDQSTAFNVSPTFCYTFPRSQAISFLSKAEIKEAWVLQSGTFITVNAEACTFDDGALRFTETNTTNNKQEISAPGLRNVVLHQPECECGIVNEIIDTSAIYIIKGNIKLNSQGTLYVPGFLAIANNLNPVLLKNDAAELKFRFVGFNNTDNTIPLYNIVFAVNGLVLTERNLLNTNNELTFAASENLPEQKWRIKKNENGTYSFMCGSSTGIFCIGLGRKANEAPTLQNPVLKPTLTLGVPDKYQQFELVKLQ